MNNKPSAIEAIKRMLGITDKQAQTLMPAGDDSPLGFPGVILDFREDEKSWAEREYEKDHRGWRQAEWR